MCVWGSVFIAVRHKPFDVALLGRGSRGGQSGACPQVSPEVGSIKKQTAERVRVIFTHLCQSLGLPIKINK